ncbi:MAG TPA: alpha-hydroxy-acid oxidizing protein [Terriglobales bacterium]|nr:alpha-hydroxy-acid oxidizing protein [Terriglobales bacterium]
MKSPQFGNARQVEIYSRGAPGAVPVSVRRLERQARRAMTPAARDYIFGAAGGEATLRANRAALERWRIVPRMLRDVSQRDLRLDLFGTTLPAPVLLAPIGVQELVHAQGDLPAAKAAAARGVPFVLSTVSSRTIEEVAAAGGARWFQLYWGKNPELTQSLVQRAAAAGYGALVVTLDTPMLGWRERDLDRGDLPFLRGAGLANFFSDPVFCSALACPPAEDGAAAVALWSRVFSNPALTWKDLAWLRAQTRLPIVLKGIQHPDDARQALDCGADGIIVSNHGGRQVDGAIGSLDALPGIARAVESRVPILFDSGIRRGADAFKALALGARAVLLGRLFLYGLALDGEAGVGAVLDNFVADFDLTLALSGYSTPGELTSGEEPALCPMRRNEP